MKSKGLDNNSELKSKLQDLVPMWRPMAWKCWKLSRNEKVGQAGIEYERVRTALKKVLEEIGGISR